MLNAEKMKEVKEIRKNTIICTICGLILVGVYHYDPPGSVGATYLIRFFGSMNLIGAILGCFTIMMIFARKEKKNDPV